MIIFKVNQLENVSFSDFLNSLLNTLTADEKYSLLNRDNLMQPIQTKLSPKEKLFSQFSCAFLKSTLHFEHPQKEDDPYS